MICCLNPNCDRPINREGDSHCQNCQAPLKSLLRNRYKVLQPLGRGGFGKTYLAEDNDKLKDLCVVKQLAFDRGGTFARKKAKDLFFLEAQQLQRLGEHPQIPSLLAYFEEDDYLYLVQQYIKGDNLAQRLQEKGIYNELEIINFLKDILPVFRFIHEREVIHRDVKLTNIMYRINDNKYIPIDFGVSKVISNSSGNTPGTSIGSQGYAAPEQLGGQAYPASDLYSLGVCCFCLLSGIESPFKLWTDFGYSWTTNWQKFIKTPLSDRTIQVFSKLLEKDVNKRYQTAQDILKEIDRSLEYSNSIVIDESCSKEIYTNHSYTDFEKGNNTNTIEKTPLSPEKFNPISENQKIIKVKNSNLNNRNKIPSNLLNLNWFGIILFAAFGVTIFLVYHLSNHKISEEITSPIQPITPVIPVAPNLNEIKEIPTGIFNYGGSTTWASIRAKVYPIIQATWPHYQLRYIDPISGNPGSSMGIKMLLDDQLSFSLSSRPLKDKEYQQATIRGHNLKQIPIAIDAIAVATNPNLPIAGLTINELSDIYTGKITNWQELGGPDLKIVPLSRHLKEGGTVDFFVANILTNQSFGKNVIELPSTTIAIRQVANNPGAIYYGSASQIVSQCTVKSLALGRERDTLVTPYIEPYLPPSQCNKNKHNKLNKSAFLSGEYPLTRRLFVIFKESDRGDTLAAKAYINILSTEQGQQLIDEAGFIGINAR